MNASGGNALRDVLLEQIDSARSLGRRSLDGLTDAEFWWEPVAGCWSVRRTTDPRAMHGNEPIGDWIIDGIRPPPADPPLTSIAWRVVHMTLGPWNWINNLESARNAVTAGRTAVEDADKIALPEPDFQPEPALSFALWDDVVVRFRSATESYDDDGLTTPVTFPWGRELPPSWIVSHVLRELVHHSAEVGCLRDVYRQTVGTHGAGATLVQPEG
jgi:hypothetical protein